MKRHAGVTGVVATGVVKPVGRMFTWMGSAWPEPYLGRANEMFTDPSGLRAAALAASVVSGVGVINCCSAPIAHWISNLENGSYTGRFATTTVTICAGPDT